MKSSSNQNNQMIALYFANGLHGMKMRQSDRGVWTPKRQVVATYLKSFCKFSGVNSWASLENPEILVDSLWEDFKLGLAMNQASADNNTQTIEKNKANYRYN